MTSSQNTYYLLARRQNRFRFVTVGILVLILLLPIEFVFGKKCHMDNHTGDDVTGDTRCPHAGESDTGTDDANTDCHSDDDSGSPGTGTNFQSDTVHCDRGTQDAHDTCDKRCCFFEPFSDGKYSKKTGITLNHTHPGLYPGSETPLFTISVITHREHPITLPAPSPIPIYLTNQVFLN